MSNSPAGDSPQSASVAAPRRALIVADSTGLGLQQQLTAAGYLTRAAALADAQGVVRDFGPDVVIMVVDRAAGGAENEGLSLARRLRAGTTTYSLPVVLVWVEDEDSLRSAAQYTGVDDYFSIRTAPAEILARLDSLFWRVEAGRRSAPVVADQRLEIDNFMFMLDAVRGDLRAGLQGTLAIIYAVAGAPLVGADFDKGTRNRTLSEVHGFFKLNLRRMDAVAFYGPTALVVYLPRLRNDAAAALARLHREFHAEHHGYDFAVGLASFPEHGGDVEGLIEKADAAAGEARSGRGAGRITVYDPARHEAPPPQPPEPPPAPVQPAQAPPPPPQQLEEEAPAPHPSPSTTFAMLGESLIREPEAEKPRVEAEEPRREVEEPRVETEVPRVEAEETRKPEPAAPAQVFAGSGSNGSWESAAEEAAAREAERRAGGAIMPRKLLLTISDNTRMTQINSLIRSAGYEARAAFDGQQALHLLRIERPDLLLLDYALQGIDGVETIRRLRKQGGGKLPLPVVMLLPSENEGARREAIELGARGVLVAPYDPAELLASLRTAGTPE